MTAQMPAKKPPKPPTPSKRPRTGVAAQAVAAQTPAARHYAVVGAGMAGVACARTLVQAGHRVTLFDKNASPGGRMATRDSAFGSFDQGAQYFTVRDGRFALALQTSPKLCKPWSANTVRVLDPLGRVAAAGLPAHEAHWVPVPGMNALVQAWAHPLTQAQAVKFQTRVTHIEADALDAKRWQLRTLGPSPADGQGGNAGDNEEHHVYSGFDAIVLAQPAPQALDLLQTSKRSTQASKAIRQQLANVQIAPCWTLMLAFPQAMQANISSLGPQWNAARSTHHRIAWLARESSKPGRSPIERWTVQASAAWSQEHLHDDAPRVQAKLQKAFSEVTGIRAEPSHADTHRWRYAQTTAPLGKSHLWDAGAGLGVCGDWCTGHRVEDAFVSGLELALAAV